MSKPAAPLRLDDFVERELASLASYGETVDAAAARFGCSVRTAERAVARVRRRWAEVAESEFAARRGRFRAQVEHAWRLALAAGDFRAVAQLARVLADVEGLRAPAKVEHSGTVNHRPVAAMSPQEREREIAVLLAKRQAALEAGQVPLEYAAAVVSAGAAAAGDLDKDDEDDEDDKWADALPVARPRKRGPTNTKRGKPRKRRAVH